MLEFFHGYALNAIDAKNRVSVPAGYRDVIERRSDARAVVLAPHEREPCLVGYDRRHSAKLAEQMDRRFGDDFGAPRDDFARLAFGATENLPFDDNGRIVLSPMLKELGELDKLAFFIAAGDTFELWNPRVLLEAKGGDARLARIVRRQLEARGEAA
jgi:MraZ protein